MLIGQSLTLQAQVSKKYAAIVVDGKSGAILHEDHAEDVRYPASLTKLMTLYIIFKKLDQKKLRLNEFVTISQHAVNQPPTKCGFKVGEKVLVRDIISGMIVKSWNDGAVAMAEHIAGSEKAFAAVMTHEARRLGMKNSTFHTASGLHHAGQTTTARDMALLARALYAYFPHYFSFFSLKNFRYKGMQYASHNKLLGRIKGVNGMKTGFTNPAGFNLIVSAIRGNHRVISVVMGGDSGRWRDQKSAELLNEGFRLLGLTKNEAGSLSETFPYKKHTGKTYRRLQQATGLSSKKNLKLISAVHSTENKNFRPAVIKGAKIYTSLPKTSLIHKAGLKIKPSKSVASKNPTAKSFLLVHTKKTKLAKKSPFILVGAAKSKKKLIHPKKNKKAFLIEQSI